MPTITLTPLPCNKVKFIDDLSIPDDTVHGAELVIYQDVAH